jgi:superfamily II DNA/RNA helicase
MNAFTDLSLLPSLIESLASQGLKRPTEIQAKTLPALLEGRSLVGVSETGSGKTLAFALPMLHQLKTLENHDSAVSMSSHPRGLVLVPARELGEQVGRVFKSLTHGTRLRVRTVLGGTKKQIARQNVGGKFEILVATPGRLVQLLDSGELRLGDVRMLVYDESDQILDPGFLPIAQRIIEECPKNVQLVLFSATLPDTLEQAVSTLFASTPMRVRTEGSQQLVRTLATDNRTVVRGRRFELLREVLEEGGSQGSILFVNTREQCEAVAEWLESEGIDYANYRGQMDRRVRRENLARFRAGDVSLLLTTDLGGRGLDIERVQRVINVHLPKDIDNYLHRVGRTARAGRSGLVVNLVTERDHPLLAKLEKRAQKRR